MSFSMVGFCCGGEIINTKQIISVGQCVNIDGKMTITPKNDLSYKYLGDDSVICI